MGASPPSFVVRRLEQLAALGIECYVDADEQDRATFEERGLRTLRLPSSKFYSCGDWFRLTSGILCSPVKFKRLLINSPSNHKLYSRFFWSIKMWPIVQVNNVDLIHLQWISMGESYCWLRNFFNCPIMASARGSQVTTYPSTRKGYIELLTKSFDQIDLIHCVSESIISKCLLLGAPSNKIVLNYNGVDTQQFSPSEQAQNKGVFSMISIGRLVWGKGFVYQLFVLKELIKNGIPARLLIVGSGPEERILKFMSSKLNIEAFVTFAGQLGEQQVLSHLQNANVYISTSIAEGLSNSVMEASACGLPVVAFECEGMQEVIDDGVTGSIVDYGDLRVFVDRLKLIAENPRIRTEMGLAGRNKMEVELNSTKCVKEMIDIYHKTQRLL